MIHFPGHRGKTPSEYMKAPASRSCRARFLTSIVVTSVTILASPWAGRAKDHVDLQFWDMIWGDLSTSIPAKRWSPSSTRNTRTLPSLTDLYLGPIGTRLF